MLLPCEQPEEARILQLGEAVKKAQQVLDEERVSPTVAYVSSLSRDPVLDSAIRAIAKATGRHELDVLRSQKPRKCVEDPREYVFQSTNYTLLCAILAQVQTSERRDFIFSVLRRIVSAPACGLARGSAQPRWNNLASELPLVAEFSVRNSARVELFQLLGEANPVPGHVLLLRQLQDMVQLEFTLFTDQEYQTLTTAIVNYCLTAEKHLQAYEKQRVTGVSFPEIGIVNPKAQFSELLSASTEIIEQCRHARYLHLKSVLLQRLNLEVNQDKGAVEGFLQSLGFSGPLLDCLNEAERLYLGPASSFDLKSSMGHLRSFLEKLHVEAVERLESKTRATDQPPLTWGASLKYLRNGSVLSVPEERLAADLYTLISDEAVHPLMAGQEDARLARNMVIEYALMFLRKLQKCGIQT